MHSIVIADTSCFILLTKSMKLICCGNCTLQYIQHLKLHLNLNL